MGNVSNGLGVGRGLIAQRLQPGRGRKDKMRAGVRVAGLPQPSPADKREDEGEQKDIGEPRRDGPARTHAQPTGRCVCLFMCATG